MLLVGFTHFVSNACVCSSTPPHPTEPTPPHLGKFEWASSSKTLPICKNLPICRNLPIQTLPGLGGVGWGGVGWGGVGVGVCNIPYVWEPWWRGLQGPINPGTQGKKEPRDPGDPETQGISAICLYLFPWVPGSPGSMGSLFHWVPGFMGPLGPWVPGSPGSLVSLFHCVLVIFERRFSYLEKSENNEIISVGCLVNTTQTLQKSIKNNFETSWNIQDLLKPLKMNHKHHISQNTSFRS